MDIKQKNIIRSVIDRVLWTAGATESNRDLLAEAIAEAIAAVTAQSVAVPEAAQQNGGLVRAALIDLLSPAIERAANSGAVSFECQGNIATVFARGRQALAQSAFDAAPECCGSTEHCERSTCPSPLMEVPAVCPQCNGTGVVSDGEIDHYQDGTPYMHGPVVCVKDCPACTPTKKGRA